MLETLMRLIFVYVFVVLAMKLLGKRQAGEMEMSELVTAFFLSELATQVVVDKEASVIELSLTILILIFLGVGISYLAIKVPLFKRIFDFSPSILIKKGKIQIRELRKNRMTLDELISLLRQGGFYDMTKVNYAILEPNGALSVVPFPEEEAPSKADLSILAQDAGFSVAVINDGKINDKALSLIGKSKPWLFDELKKHKVSSIKDVFMLQSDFSGRTQVCLNPERSNSHQK